MIEVPHKELIPQLVELMEQGHTITLRLTGVSMRPFLEDRRDSALMRLATDPQVGEAVLAEVSPDKYVLHRIVKIEGEDVTLRGDGNLRTEQCKLKDIKAQMIGFYRKGRTTIDSVDGWKWKTYSWVWQRLFPIRRYLLAFYRRIWIPCFGTI